VYLASNLPPELQVPPTTHGKLLDLSRLAVPQQRSSVIGVGDVLEVTIAHGYEEEDPVPTPVRVTEAGVVNLALVGPVMVAGLEPAQAEQAIAREAVNRDLYLHPNVTVVIEEKHKNHVTVLGAVKTQGVVELERSNSDLVGALAMAEGLTEDAGTEIQIMRQVPAGGTNLAGPPPGGGGNVQLASYSSAPGPVTRVAQRVDLIAATQGGNIGDYRLNDGDVVMVHEKEPRYVYVMGLVNEPQQVEILPGEDLRLLSALATAKGRKFEFADKVHVMRQMPGQAEPAVIEVSVREAKRNGNANLILGAGDVVSVEETPLTVVAGAIQQVLRFGISGSVPLF
jgi:protein involved in polysaccharide export with SLBB domain